MHTSTAIKLNITDIHQIEVQNSKQMHEYIVDCIRVAKKGVVLKTTFEHSAKNIQKTPYFFALSAVSDFVPLYPQSGKIKKRDIGDSWSLKLIKNTDILEQLDKNDIYTIGFKAELDKTQAEQNATNMLKDKNLSAVCLNMIGQHNFGNDNSNIQMFFGDDNIKLKNNDKLSLAFDILSHLQRVFSE